MVNYNEEVKRLDAYKPEDSQDFWKPKSGQYKVKALSELEDAEPYVEDNKEPKPQVKVRLLIEDRQVTWTMGIGKSPASSYGQLCKLAVSSNGKLTDLEFMIVVTNDGTKNTYTIVKTM